MAIPTKQRWTLTVDLDGERLSWAEETELIRAIEDLPRVRSVTLKREEVESEVPDCGLRYGTFGAEAVCRRPSGHPLLPEDGIGHSVVRNPISAREARMAEAVPFNRHLTR